MLGFGTEVFYDFNTGIGWRTNDNGYGGTLLLSENMINNLSDTSAPKTAVRLGLFDVNFFRNEDVVDEYGQIVSSNILGAAVGNIYKILRNLCIVLMMLVLLYIGIRIIVSTVASDQSKYKKMLMDWLVGLCLLFVMHYIMSFFMNMNSLVVEMLRNDEGDFYYIALADLQDNREGTDSTWLDMATGVNIGELVNDLGNQAFFRKKIIVEASDNDEKGFNVSPNGYVDITEKDYIMYKNRYKDDIDLSQWGDNGKIQLSANVFNSSNDNEKFNNKAIYKANIMEYARTLSSFGLKNSDNVNIYANGRYQSISAHKKSDEDDYWAALGYAILYLALVIETVMFAIIYFKRVLQLAMLTMIAPLVSLMYPLDKVGDGQAQAYNGWLKDYMFNVLIQPLHLLLYSIFIGAASELFTKNIIYALAVYAFMIPAEKYFKKIFGFDKASGSPVGAFGGAFGGHLAMRGFEKLTGFGPPGKGKGGSSVAKDRKAIKIKKDKPQPSSESDSSSLRTDGVLGAASHLATKGGSKLPGSSGGAGGSMIPGSLGSSGGSKIPGSSGGLSSSISTGGNLSSGAGLGKKQGRVRNLAQAGRGLMGRSFTRAITGGKYDSLKGLSGTAKFSAIGGTIAKKGANIAGRTFGTLALGSAGLMAGAATAIATGDASNLTKGLSAGALAGFNRGGQFADWGSNKIGGIISDTSAELANIDEGYRAKYRADQAITKFDPTDLTDERIESIQKYARFTDFDGSKDSVDAITLADQLANGDEYNAMALYDDAGDYPDFRIKSNREAYINRELSKEMEKVDLSDAELNRLYAESQEAELKQVEQQKKEAEKKNQAQIKAMEDSFKKQEEEIQEKYKEKIDDPYNDSITRMQLEQDRDNELSKLKEKRENEVRKLQEQQNDMVNEFESKKSDIQNRAMDSDFINSAKEDKARANLNARIDNELIPIQRKLKK